MESERIARIARDAFLNEFLFQGFTDIRKRPAIKLQAILMSLFAMPLLGMRNLLSNDREARTERYKRLFGCRRKIVASDSTFARVLKWLNSQEGKRFLLGFLKRFERRDLLRTRLSPKGRLRRLGILDGSYMGGHWLVTLCLPGKIDYPVAVERFENQGQEQAVAREMMQAAPQLLGAQRPELWLLDALHFSGTTMTIARGQRAHVLFKFKEAEYRTVTADAQNLFRHCGGDEKATGWDAQRGCRWKLRKTLDRFLGYPVQVVELTEHYPKRKRDRTVTCWIVTTDVDLPLEEVREAAHQRWLCRVQDYAERAMDCGASFRARRCTVFRKRWSKEVFRSIHRVLRMTAPPHRNPPKKLGPLERRDLLSLSELADLYSA